MEQVVKKDILSILTKSYEAIKRKEYYKLKNISDTIIHNTVITQDDSCILLTVLIYSLSKIYERENYREYDDFKILDNTIITELKKALNSVSNDKIMDYEESLRNILNIPTKLTSKLKGHVKEIIENAKINRASRLYEHGVSLGRTAEILGISEFDLMSYAGKTGISDVSLGVSKKIKDRINFTRGLFK